MAKFSVPKFNLAHKPNIPDIEQFKKFVIEKIGDTSKLTLSFYEDKELHRKCYQEIVEEWEKRRSLEKLPPKTFNKIPIVAALSFDDKAKLIDNNEFRRAWIECVVKQKNTCHARKIYRAVLHNYNSYQPHLKHVFGYCKPLIRSATLRSCKKLAALDERYGLLSHYVVKNIADYILSHKDKSIDEILLAMGIAGSLREAEISAAVGKELLACNRACLQHEDDSMLARTLEYFQNDTNDTDDTLRLNYMRNDLLTSLLENYLEQDPPANIKQQIETFTDRYLGDPRANPKWHGVKEEIRNIVARWKVGVTLGAFFALLDDVAQHDDTHDRHWRARKEFWQGYLDADKITGAWVVLGIEYFYHHHFLDEKLKFAKFSTQAGIQSSHCAIIMQINNYVLTEWSHVGGLRIWEADDRRAPKLYQDTYHPPSLKNMKMNEEGYIRHQGDWQAKARAILEGEKWFRRWL